MKKIFPVTLFLFFVVLILPNYATAVRGIGVKPISPVGKRITGDNWLFVIGINTYLHWPRLETATNDARALRDVLLERYHYHQDYLIELYDEDATRRNIISKLRYLAKNLTENDSLLIFYAGHGHLDSITKEGSWVPVESGEKDASSRISNHDIKNYLKIDAVKAKHILLVSDSCFSGDFFRGHRGRLPEVTDKVIKKAWGLPSRQAITSGGLEPVTDAGFGGNSVFSHFMVATLKENTNPFLIPSDLFPAIKAGVAENAEQFPRFGTLKDTGGSQGGEYIFFLRQDTRLNDVSAKAQKSQAELDRLKQLDTEMQAARKLEESEIKKREKELSILDSQIDEMRKKLGTSSAGAGDSLDNMLVMVERKEEQQKRLEVLKIKRVREERNRKAELARLKIEKRKKLESQLEDDICKYNKIISSPYGKQMKEAAWKSLVANYPDASEIGTGDVAGLKLLVIGDKGLETITMVSKVYPWHKKSLVTFSHQKHNVDYKIACAECHHVYKDGKNVWKEGDEVGKCGCCHSGAKAPKEPKLSKAENIKGYHYAAIHENCAGCHKAAKKDGKAAPTKCSECHPKVAK